MENRFIRKVSVTESIYVNIALNVVSHSEIRGPITRVLLKRAVALLEEKYEILQSRIIAKAGGYKFVKANAHRKLPLTWKEGAELQEIYTHLLNSSLDLRNGLYQVIAVSKQDGCHIFLLTSHSIADAQALITLHASFMECLETVYQQQSIKTQAQPLSADIDFLVGAYLQSKKNLPHVKKSFAADRRYIQLPVLTESLSNNEKKLIQFVIEPNIMQKMILHCKKYQFSVHSLLIVIFALAIRSVVKTHDQEILMRSSVSLRKRIVPPIDDLICMTAITAITLQLTLGVQEIEDIARSVFLQLKEVTENVEIAQAHLQYSQTIDKKNKDAIAAINISNMGRIELKTTANFSQLAFDYACGWENPLPNVSIVTCNNQLVANLVYGSRFFSPSVISELIQNVLTSICRVVEEI